MEKTKIAVCIAALFLVQEVAAQTENSSVDGAGLFGDIPDIETSRAEYIDPRVERRSSCQTHPGRPAWVMIQEQGFEWKAELALLWRGVWTGRQLADSDVCTCDMLHPDWETIRPEIEEIWETVGHVKRSEWKTENSEVFFDLRGDIASEARGYSRQIGLMCGSPE